MSRINLFARLFLVMLACVVFCDAAKSQKKTGAENKITRLENEVKSLSEKIRTLDARLSALEVLSAFRSPEELRHAMIEASKGAIINDLNNLASAAYQYRIRPASMGGGNGNYNGFTIPRRLASNDNADYESIVQSDSVLIFTGTSKHKFGSVKAALDKDGRLGSFEYTGEFP